MDEATWELCGKAIAQLPELEWGVKGTATVTATVAGVSSTFSGINFDKTVTVSGFNNLKHVNIESFTMANSTGVSPCCMPVCTPLSHHCAPWQRTT